MSGRSTAMQGFLILVLAVMFCLSPAGIKLATGEERPALLPAPAVSATPEATPAPSVESDLDETDLEENEKTLEQGMDEAHERLQRKILEQTIRLDNFFGSEKDFHRRQTEYFLRLRNSIRVERGGNLKYGLSARANFILSKISDRLRLSISGESEPEPFAPSLPEDPGNPGFDRTSQTTRIVNTELRYELLHTPSMELFAGAGVRLVIPPVAFLRTRFQYNYHLSDVSLLRVAETLFVRSSDAIGETTEFSLERLLDPKTVLKWATAGTVSYETKGLEWGSELSVSRELSNKSAITLLGGVYGNTGIDDTMSNYRILTRFRRNFLRDWLYYELEPEVSWPRRADGQFPPTFAITFLLEVVLKGSAEKGK